MSIPPPPPLLGSSHQSQADWDLTHLTSSFHSQYHRLEDITKFFNELSNAFPHLVELVRVGQSTEGREILAIKIEEVCWAGLLEYPKFPGPVTDKATTFASYLLPHLSAREQESASADSHSRSTTCPRREHPFDVASVIA